MFHVFFLYLFSSFLFSLSFNTVFPLKNDIFPANVKWKKILFLYPDVYLKNVIMV